MKDRARREPAASPELQDEMEELAKCVDPLAPKQVALFTKLFPILVDLHRGFLTTLLRRWRLAPHEIDDLTQVVLLDAFNLVCNEGFRRGDFEGILRHCFGSKISNYLRNRANRRETDLPTSSAERPHSLRSEERTAILLAAINAVRKTFSELDDLIFALVLVRSVPHQEAADLLGITPGTLKSHVAAIRAQLAEAAGAVGDVS